MNLYYCELVAGKTLDNMNTSQSYGKTFLVDFL